MSKIELAYRYLMSNNLSPKSAITLQVITKTTALGSLMSDLRKKPWHCDVKCTHKGRNPKTKSQINFYEILSFAVK